MCPPHYNAHQNKSLFKHINDSILALRTKYEDPYIFLGGDFNSRNFRLAVEVFPQIKAIHTSPTRGRAVLDILSSNYNDSLVDSSVVEPICTEKEIQTDHMTVFACFRMPRVPSYNIEQYSYRHLTAEGHDKFGGWLAAKNWSCVLNAVDLDVAVEALHCEFEKGMAHAYETKTRKKKSSEPPWMTDWLRKDIADRRKVFRTDKGRSPRCHAMKLKTNKAVKKRRGGYHQLVIDKFREETNPGKFFQYIKCLMGKNAAPPWSPTQMYPAKTVKEVADCLAAFFNAISNEYQPLDKSKIPVTFRRELSAVTVDQVLDKLKKAKKPSSTVPGNIPALLYTKFPLQLAPVIVHVFNLILRKKNLAAVVEG